MKYWITSILIALQFTFLAQNATVRTPIDLKREANRKASEHIRLLSSSVILFRLDSKSEQIAYYEKYNNIHAAEKLKAETRNFNLNLIQSFRASFTFCPVYFFEDTYSETLLKGNIDDVIFYDDSLKTDLLIRIPAGSNYYIAAHGITRDDDPKQYRSDYYIASDTSGTVKKTRYYDDGNLSIQALVIMDAQFNQLQRPFPYYYKLATNKISPSRLRFKVKTWNDNIEEFAKKNQ